MTEIERIIMKNSISKAFHPSCGLAAICLAAGLLFPGQCAFAAEAPSAQINTPVRDYHFDKTISRQVLENYLSRSIVMEGLLNGRGDLKDNIRMLKSIGAKYIGRALCLWGAEANFLANVDRAKSQIPQVL